MLLHAYEAQISTLDNALQPYDKQFETELKVRLKKRQHRVKNALETGRPN